MLKGIQVLPQWFYEVQAIQNKIDDERDRIAGERGSRAGWAGRSGQAGADSHTPPLCDIHYPLMPSPNPLIKIRNASNLKAVNSAR